MQGRSPAVKVRVDCAAERSGGTSSRGGLSAMTTFMYEYMQPRDRAVQC